jgi:hypothetical protein
MMAVNRRRSQVHSGPQAPCDARVLGVTDAHQRWLRRMSRTRWCRRRSHRSTSGGRDAARRQRKTHVVHALEQEGELESEGRRCGGSRWSSRVYIGGQGSAGEG